MALPIRVELVEPMLVCVPETVRLWLVSTLVILDELVPVVVTVLVVMTELPSPSVPANRLFVPVEMTVDERFPR